MRRGFVFAGEMGNEVHAVETAWTANRSYGGSRRGEIECADGMFVNLPAGDGAGPRDEKRHVHAAFGEHAFFTVERRVQAAVPAAGIALERRIDLVDFQRCAVVADEKDERSFGKTMLFQSAGDEAHAVIHGGQHAERGAAALRHLAGKSCFVVRRCVQRRVRRTVGDVEEEGLVFVALDDGCGGLRAAVDVIHGWREIAHGLILAVERDVRRKRTLGVLSEGVLEAVRGDGGRRAEMPLAEMRRGVARILQARGDGGLLVEAIE